MTFDQAQKTIDWANICIEMGCDEGLPYVQKDAFARVTEHNFETGEIIDKVILANPT